MLFFPQTLLRRTLTINNPGVETGGLGLRVQRLIPPLARLHEDSGQQRAIGMGARADSDTEGLPGRARGMMTMPVHAAARHERPAWK